MEIGRLKKHFKWNYGIEIRKRPSYRLGFSPFIKIWFFKFKFYPFLGEQFSKKHYRGFYLNFEPLSYFYIITRTFKNPFRIGSRYYNLPVKIIMK